MSIVYSRTEHFLFRLAMKQINLVLVDNDWYCNLSIEDFIDFFVFIEQTQDVNNVVYKDWKKSIWGLWEEANNCYLNLEAI